MRNFEAHTDEKRKEMLKNIGMNSIEELFSCIPTACRMGELPLDNPISEMHAQKELLKLSEKNNTDFVSFLGGGAVKKFIPSAISDVASRFEFLSAYTPYQPEISQGTLQIMYEFQSMICKLTGMDVSNASVYDGGTACAEACLMAVRINKVKNIFISDKLNPNYIEVIKTYLWAQDINYTIADTAPEEDFAGKIYAFPDYSGELNNLPEKTGKELLIACVDLSVLPCVEPPCADITVGDYQPFGLPLSFGGAYGGFISAKDIYKRQLPGRIAGKTTDKNGKDAYVLTLQAREQHIRRSKATGNICSNQALTALCATLYLSLMGENGIVEAANISYKNAHLLADGLVQTGYTILNSKFFNSFTLKMKNGVSTDEFLSCLREKGILGGIKLDNERILVTATEFNEENEIELYITTVQL